jgi:hypothetical protein
MYIPYPFTVKIKYNIPPTTALEASMLTIMPLMRFTKFDIIYSASPSFKSAETDEMKTTYSATSNSSEHAALTVKEIRNLNPQDIRSCEL